MQALLIVMSLALASSAAAAPPATAVTTLSVGSETRTQRLDGRLERLRDPSRRLTLRQVLGRPFSPPTGEIPNYGLTTDAVWFRVRLRSSLRHQQRFYLQCNYVILDRLEIFVRSDQRAPRSDLPPSFVRHVFGDTQPGAPRLSAPTYVLALDFAPGEVKTLYLRVVTDGSLQLPLELFHPDAFATAQGRWLLFYGSILGILMMLLFYDVLLFVLIRERSYLDYSLCVLFCLLFVGYLSGILQTYVLPPLSVLTNEGYLMAMVSANLFMHVFTRRFLELRARMPFADLLFRGLIALALPVYPLALFTYRAPLLLTVAIAVLGAISALLVGITSWRRGYRPARFYVLGWSAFFLGVLIFTTQKLGLLSINTITENAAVLGFLATVLFLPLGLADRITLLREQRAEAQRRALRLKAEMAASLEREVAEKTEDLRIANEDLAANYEQLQRESEQRAQAEERRQSLEQDLFETQKMDAIGRLAGGVAHDMNNILAAIGNAAASLGTTFAGGDGRSAEIDDILAATRRGGELAHNLLGFARRGQFRKEPLAIGTTIEEMQRLLRRTIHQGIEIEVDVADDLRLIEGDASQLGQIVVNLAVNAAQAMGDKGCLTIRAQNTTLAQGHGCGELGPGPYVCLEVADTGRGMDDQTLERVFEPFFTTKPPGEGTGLGLSMVYGAVQTHGGHVSFESALGEGTVAKVLLPAYEGEATPAPPAAPTPNPQQGSPSGAVLLVDDERLLRRGASRLLRRLGYPVIQAEEGAEALELFDQHRQTIAVVVLDLIMPVMDGVETFHRLRELDPSLPVVLSSGYSPEGAAAELLAEGAVAFVQKPYDAYELIEAIDQAMQAMERSGD